MDHKIIESKKKPENKLEDKLKNPLDISTEQPYSVIDFYLQPEFIKILTQQVANQPAVDLVKITALKTAIKNQSFNLNNLNLAEKIINFETKLF